MRLWTFQHPAVIEALCRRGTFVASWARVAPRRRRATLRLVEAMAERGLQTTPHPPVWAWHSCGGWGQAPDLAGGAQAAALRVELEVPSQRALLAPLEPWERLCAEEGDPEQAWRELLALRPDEPAADVLAALPELERSWVRRVGWAVRAPTLDLR